MKIFKPLPHAQYCGYSPYIYFSCNCRLKQRQDARDEFDLEKVFDEMTKAKIETHIPEHEEFMNWYLQEIVKHKKEWIEKIKSGEISIGRLNRY